MLFEPPKNMACHLLKEEKKKQKRIVNHKAKSISTFHQNQTWASSALEKKSFLIWAYAFISLFILNWLHVHLLSFKPCDDFTFYLFLWEELVPLELELNI